MKIKNTLIMAALVVVLGAFLYFSEIRGRAERDEAELVAQRLLRFETENVTGLTLEGDEETIVLKRTDDRWRITAPFDVAADDSAINSLIGAVQRADHDRLIDEEPEDLSRFGLDEPEVRATFQFDDGSSQSLDIGNGTAVGFNVFVRASGASTVYTTGGSLKTSVGKSLFDLRDRSVLSFADVDVARLEIDGGGREATVERGPELGDGIDRWRLSEPIDARADAETVSSVLSRLRVDRVLAYASDAPTDEDISDFGLAEPQLVVRVWTNDDASQTLEIGAESTDPPGHYARRAGGSSVFVIPKSLFDAVPQSIDDLRNRTVAEFARDRVEVIEIEGAGGDNRLEKDGVDWRISGPQPLEADASTVSSVLTTALALRATEFASGSAATPAFGLDDPYLRVTFELEPPIAAADDTEPATGEEVVLLLGALTETEVEADDDAVAADAASDADTPPATEMVPARYVGVSGDSTVYVVEEETLADLVVNRFALRSKTLVSFTKADLDRIELASGGSTYQFEKDDEDAWTIAGPLVASDIGSAVDDMLWNFNFLRMESIVAEPAAGGDTDLGPYGLDTPALRVRAFVAESMVGEVSIGADVPAEAIADRPEFAPENQTYATVGGHPGVFAIDAKLRDSLRQIVDALSSP